MGTEKVTKTKVEGEEGILKLKAMSLKKLSKVCGSLEKLDLNIGNLDEDIVDGFLFKSYSQASDFPPMQPLFNFEEKAPGMECTTLAASLPGPRHTSAADEFFVGAAVSSGTW